MDFFLKQCNYVISNPTRLFIFYFWRQKSTMYHLFTQRKTNLICTNKTIKWHRKTNNRGAHKEEYNSTGDIMATTQSAESQWL